MKILSLLLLVVGITFSCTKEPSYIEDIVIFDVRVATTISEETIVQSGISLLLPSEDFSLDQTYTVSVSSPDSLYQWEKDLTPISSENRVYLYFNDMLMNAHQEIPSGLYTIEIFQDDLSFLTTSYQYQRNVVDEQLPPLSIKWEQEGGDSYLSWNIQDGYLYDIKLYSYDGQLAYHAQDSTGMVLVGELKEDEIHKIVIVANDYQASIIDVYRIIN
jgi:hypothetical protein